jgi:hypothetical protein
MLSTEMEPPGEQQGTVHHAPQPATRRSPSPPRASARHAPQPEPATRLSPPRSEAFGAYRLEAYRLEAYRLEVHATSFGARGSPAKKCRALRMVVSQMARSASSVKKALWGVTMTFGKLRSVANS